MSKILKSWLCWVLILAALLGPIVVAAINRLSDVRLATEMLRLIPPTPTETTLTECTPALEPTIYEQLNSLTLDQETDLAIVLRMDKLFSADQAARYLPGSDAQQLDRDDTARRVEVSGYIQNGQIHNERDLVYAAFIFQHGDCPEHYHFANQLAKIALDAGYEEAGWIYAATLDRYLMSLGELQKFGTQYTRVEGELKLYPVDPTTTDAERARYNVPPLSEIEQTRSDELNAGSRVSIRQWLESWWLTLIGAAFATLGAAMCIIEVKPKPGLGKVMLAMAVAIYGLSIFGHYSQVKALAQGTYEAGQRVWGWLNILLIGVWCILGGMEAIRWIRGKTGKHNAQPTGEVTGNG